MYFYKRILAISVAVFVLISIAQTQNYEVFKGTQLQSFKKSFTEMEEQEKLYPEMKTSGRRIKNNFEKYPDLPFDESQIKYQAKASEYIPTILQKETSPPPDQDFLGLDDSGGSIPPDVNGCPGPNHLMVTLNTDTRIMDKEGTPISTISTGIFWHPLAGSGDTFDPKISYDPYKNRWIYVIPSGSTPSTTKLFVGVSETSDPTGNWFIYSFDGDPNNNHWFDYPNYGFNKDKLVVTGNMFGGGSVYVAIYVFDLNDFYNNVASINYTRISSYNGFTIVPAKTYDEDEEDIFMVHNAGGDNNGYGYINLWKITGDASDPDLVNLGLIGVQAPWSNGSYAGGGNFAPQLGTSAKINTVDARMENMIFRNGKLWTTHHVYLPAGNPNRCSVQWWELDPYDVSINQWGRVDDPTGEMYSAFATIAVNAKEDVMIGFCSFSENQYASSSYVLRYGDDPANTMREPYQYKDGLAPYWKTFGADRNRWGDYTATYVDPVDDLDFWTLQEYADLPTGDDHWGTWWANVDLHAIPEAGFSSTFQEIPIQSSNSYTDLSKFTPESWEWHFEGGEPAISTEQNPQNIYYAQAGTFDVTLIAGNSIGKDTIKLENYIDVNTTILPVAQFNISDTLPNIGESVLFEDISLYNPVSWTWEFSPNLVTFLNGTNENSQHPEVGFDNPYNYSVTLVAENNNGITSITKQSLVSAGGVQLPFVEDFEAASFDAKGWTIDNPDEEKTWEVLPLTLNNNKSEFATYVNIKNYNGFGERDRLITPLLNFYYHKDITFSFSFAYAQRNANTTDSLIVYLSENGGVDWSRLLTLAEDTTAVRKFSTHAPSFSNFLPTDTAYWCGAIDNPQCVNVDLSDYYGKPNMRIMFETYNGFGNNILIDDINIEGTISAVPEITSSQNELSIYPNPSNGLVFVSLKELIGNKSLTIIDLTGRVVFEKTIDSNVETFSVNLEHLQKGIYIIKAHNLDSTQTQKLILR